MTVLDIIRRSTEFLAAKGVDSPRLQIELLLAHVLKMPRLNLYLNFERILTGSELDLLWTMVERRGDREPLQHIVGSACFCGLELRVTSEALIPRSETELLAEEAVRTLQTLPEATSPDSRALDFGTGSGCLAIHLAVHCPAVRVVALDTSAAALKLAHENAVRHDVANRIRFLCGDGFDALPEDLRFDLIVSNPPYIPSAEIETLAPEVRDHDPRLALDGGDDGLKFYRLFAARAGAFLRPGRKLLLEFGDGQEEALGRLFTEPVWHVEAVRPDYSGRPRILIARRIDS